MWNWKKMSNVWLVLTMPHYKEDTSLEYGYGNEGSQPLMLMETRGQWPQRSYTHRWPAPNERVGSCFWCHREHYFKDYLIEQVKRVVCKELACLRVTHHYGGCGIDLLAKDCPLRLVESGPWVDVGKFGRDYPKLFKIWLDYFIGSHKDPS